MDFKKFHVNNDIREAETLPKRFYKDKGIYEEVKEKIFVKSSIGFFKVSGIKLPPNLPPYIKFLSCWSIRGIPFLIFKLIYFFNKFFYF